MCVGGGGGGGNIRSHCWLQHCIKVCYQWSKFEQKYSINPAVKGISVLLERP